MDEIRAHTIADVAAMNETLIEDARRDAMRRARGVR